MSLLARQKLVSQLAFQNASQAADLLSLTTTRTELIALLLHFIALGFRLEITSVKSDHHDDSDLGFHCHFNGFAADLWPLASATPGDYLDPADPQFVAFLKCAAACPWLYQIGLAGSADTVDNRQAAGESVFPDDGEDHIHLGAAG